MSRLNVSDETKFRLIAWATLVASAVALAITWPAIGSLRHQRALELAMDAELHKLTDTARAVGEYRVAITLDPENHALTRRLSDVLVSHDEIDSAINTLKQLPIGESGLDIARLQLHSHQFDASLKTLARLDPVSLSSSALMLKSQVLLELDQGDEAIKSAKLARQLEDSADTQLNVGLILGAARPTELTAYIATVASPEPAGTLTAAGASITTLGQLLYDRGLLASSQRVLTKAQDNSQALLLLADIKFAGAHPTKSDLNAARDYLAHGLTIDPGRLELHQAMQNVLAKLGDKAGVDHESDLINQLVSGKI